MTSAPKSCTAPTKMPPSTTHSIAGSQPQMTAMAGPSMGDSPVIEAYWWPKEDIAVDRDVVDLVS